MLVPSNSATQLMQVRQTITIGIVDENRIRVGNVQSALDDRCCQQHVKLVVDEIDHHLFQLTFRHLSMADFDRGFGHDVSQLLRKRLDVMHAIVDEVDLAVTAQFPHDRMANQLVTRTSDASVDSHAILRRRFQIRDIANPGQRHVQGSWDRCGTQRQHVDGATERLQAFLDFDAEPLLFVDDQQSKIAETDVPRGQAMRTNHNIDASLRQARQPSHAVLSTYRSG